MPTQLILNFLADDRPGIVDALSQEVTGAGGNWLESRTARLAGKFAGIILVETPDAATAAGLKAGLRALAAKGIAVTATDARDEAEAAGASLTITLVGPDRPGIVREIAHCLALHGASIDAMETSTSDAPMGGGTLFHAQIEAHAAAGMDDEELRAELERLAAALMVDLELVEAG